MMELARALRVDLLIKLVLAVLLGGIIGFEREVAGKPAGLRTNILICIGACLFTIISGKFFADPARISAQLVTGIGFLGAGAIMREGEHVRGLTTAATIWAVAAIGMSIGYGHYTLAGMVTLTILFVQLAFTPLDILINDWQERHTFRVVSKSDDAAYKIICKIFDDSGLEIYGRKLMKKNNLFHSEWFAAGGRKKQEKVMQLLVASDEVLEVTY